jgi:ABC-type lipoprotein release transport system permease subunit
MDCKNLPMFFFLTIAFGRRLFLQSSSGFLCLIANSYEISATKRFEKDQLKTDTSSENYFKEIKKISKDEEYKKQLDQMRCVETVKFTVIVLIVLVLFINWLFIGFGFLYVFGICGFLYFFINRAAENTDFTK